MTVAGHLWTVSTRLRKAAAPQGRSPWRVQVEDAQFGRVSLSGLYYPEPNSRTLVLAIHGLGGCAESHYMFRAAAAAKAAGWSCLSLNLRGADRRGEDYYHAGLIEDLEAALGSGELETYRNLFIVGFSLGGHTVLRWAAHRQDPRVRAVAAVCAPVDLAASSSAFASIARLPYRRYVMARLKEIYRPVAARREVPLPLEQAEEIRTLREWDERIVAPRHGFQGAADYYRRMSVGPELAKIDLPALYVGAVADPMVPMRTVRPVLEGSGSGIQSVWTHRGGHMAFPQRLDLGFGGSGGLERQVLRWFSGFLPEV
ncbi:MAG: alpha/beta fold hydrolase [Deltaproteobacteria bacterium]|nr:alpha/beta fold hydrolase [Deltaproteobacteria bacterium]